MKILFSLWILLFITNGLVFAQTDEGYHLEENIPYYTAVENTNDTYKAERCVLDLYYPINQSNFPTIVWFFGGGLTGGSKYIPEVFRKKGIAVVAVNYRLNPQVACPAYIQDAAAAISWTFNQIKQYGGSPDKIFISGHSSGAYLAAMVGLDKQWLANRGKDANNLAGIFPLSGQCITHSTVRNERRMRPNQPLIDEFAPSYHVRKDAPPIILITGGQDLDNPARYEENVYMHRMLEVIGHPYTKLYELEGFDHGGMVNPGCQIVLKEMQEILK